MAERRTGGSEAGYSRRAMLAAAGGLTVATSGCVRQVRSIVNRDDIEQLSLTITTRPADGDRESIQLAREIAAVFDAVGADVSIEMRSNEEVNRAILFNYDFDVYVGQHPGGTDPDFLYEALHSLYADESGWQNPFGFTNLHVDELLEEQRRVDPADRDEAVADALEAIALEQPFVPICVPEEHRLVRTDRFDGWGDRHPATGPGYLGLDPSDGVDGIRAAHTDARPSENANPIMAEYRDLEAFVDLLYDPLAIEIDGELTAWAAESWDWNDGTLAVTLRDDLRFHDDDALDASDVAFTYRFLADTTLGEGVSPSPSPRYRGRTSAVDADAIEFDDDEGRVELPVDANRPVAERALTVPILPEHVWKPRSAAADLPGVRVAQGTTEAVVTDNWPPIGSGPFRFSSRSEREHVTLERFDDHFTRRSGVELPEPTVETVRFQIDPRSTSAIELVNTNEADITSDALETYVLDGVEETDDTRLLESPSWTFYHLGFNARKAPFSNPRFRRVVARLLDKAWLVEEVFHGHARPIATPVPEEWTPGSLEWNGEDPETPFLGTDGTGALDVEAARSAFEEAGFRYAADGTLRVRQ
ncbi:ABC transporter substrate-binding protein [Halosolutus gelatinilyticus]|uniref:ABC transporter substrate-binding protein n=1 Tax=Halosolutus gelatinilyticus TaxID=2931975 RepID=UPI001FF394C7|nr:ABC transporter substrate-binding protein [Halosolutus gelatinilyticus]